MRNRAASRRRHQPLHGLLGQGECRRHSQKLFASRRRQTLEGDLHEAGADVLGKARKRLGTAGREALIAETHVGLRLRALALPADRVVDGVGAQGFHAHGGGLHEYVGECGRPLLSAELLGRIGACVDGDDDQALDVSRVDSLRDEPVRAVVRAEDRAQADVVGQTAVQQMDHFASLPAMRSRR